LLQLAKAFVAHIILAVTLEWWQFDEQGFHVRIIRNLRIESIDYLSGKDMPVTASLSPIHPKKGSHATVPRRSARRSHAIDLIYR
jgi:hypothetical protein